jgi:hypothetical protein
MMLAIARSGLLCRDSDAHKELSEPTASRLSVKMRSLLGGEGKEVQWLTVERMASSSRKKMSTLQSAEASESWYTNSLPTYTKDSP